MAWAPIRNTCSAQCSEEPSRVASAGKWMRSPCQCSTKLLLGCHLSRASSLGSATQWIAPRPSSFSCCGGAPTCSGCTLPPAATARSCAPRQIPSTGRRCWCQALSQSSSSRNQSMPGWSRSFTLIGPPSTRAMLFAHVLGSGSGSPRSGLRISSVRPRCRASSPTSAASSWSTCWTTSSVGLKAAGSAGPGAAPRRARR